MMGEKKVVADFGCGDAALALAVGDQHTVHSFDLFKANDRVVQCGIIIINNIIRVMMINND